MKPGKKGIERIINAAGYSMKGLKFAWTHEAAFRQEIVLGLVLIPIAVLLDVTVVEKILLIACCLLVLITELLNSAVEAVVDRIGPEFHDLAGRAKDLGSAAVLISLLLTILTWCWILFDRYIST